MDPTPAPVISSNLPALITAISGTIGTLGTLIVAFLQLKHKTAAKKKAVSTNVSVKLDEPAQQELESIDAEPVGAKPRRGGILWLIVVAAFFAVVLVVATVLWISQAKRAQEQLRLRQSLIREAEGVLAKEAEAAKNLKTIQDKLTTTSAELTEADTSLKRTNAELVSKKQEVATYQALLALRGKLVCIIDSHTRKLVMGAVSVELDYFGKSSGGQSANVLVDQEPIPDAEGKTVKDKITNEGQAFAPQMLRIIERRPDLIIVHWHALRPAGVSADDRLANRQSEKELLEQLYRVLQIPREKGNSLPRILVYSRIDGFTEAGKAAVGARVAEFLTDKVERVRFLSLFETFELAPQEETIGAQKLAARAAELLK